MSPVGVAVIGCGNISKQYLQNLTAFPDVAVVTCADVDVTRAKAQATAYGVPEWGSAADALGHPGVQLIVNLTIPAAHAEVTAAAIAAAVTSAWAAGMVRFTINWTPGWPSASSGLPHSGTP